MSHISYIMAMIFKLYIKMNTIYANYSFANGLSHGYAFGASGFSGLPVSTNFLTVGVNYNSTHNTWSGNLSAWSVDKSGFTFDPSVSAMVFPERTTNLARGQGFRNNNQVLQRYVDNNQHQKALDYFGFEGTYDPDNALFDNRTWPAAVHRSCRG